jgi:diketogulonate reductase-like aldo/keto reductase
MQIPTKKLNSGFEMPLFGLGTYQMGEAGQDQTEVATIKEAIVLGITHIDSAEAYAEGHAEELVGQAIEKYDRKKLFLVSKVREYNLNYTGVKQALLESLKRMKTSYLDLYLMHRYPGSDQKLKESLKAMTELKEQGLIKNIGISNFNTKHTAQAQEWSKYPIVATQVHYNLQFREAVKNGLLEYCQNNDMLLIAWRPVNKGKTTKSNTNLTASGISLLDEMCVKYKKTPAQIAINWLIAQPNVVTLTKTSAIEHLKENLGSIGWEMEKDDVEKLRNEFPDQKFISDSVPLA